MPRANVSDVKQIVTTDTVDAKILVHIKTASAFVDQVFAGDTTLSEDVLKEIERYIAAHFLTVTEPEHGGLVEHEIGATRARFPDNLGKFLEGTRYGQQALLLDVTGKLSGAGAARAQFRAV